MYVIEINNLSKRFRNTIALQEVSFNVNKGEIFGLLGPNGSGKTTLIRCLLGLIRPTSGSATLFNQYDIVRDMYEIRKRSSLLPQEANCVEMLTARENILYQGGIHSGDVIPKEELEKRTDELLEVVELVDRQHELTKTFSGGMKRRVMVASTLITDPDLIFLDEPTTGIDILGAQTIRTLIQNLSSQNKSIFLTTHDLTDINELCDRVAIIVNGRIITLGTPADLEVEHNVQDIKDVYTKLVRKARLEATIKT
ncbi:ABC transporter ATP-binding protein [Candidatus Hodarchaeum mangrovi]